MRKPNFNPRPDCSSRYLAQNSWCWCQYTGISDGTLASAPAMCSSPMTRVTRQVAQNRRTSATPMVDTMRQAKRRIGVIRRLDRVSFL